MYIAEKKSTRLKRIKKSQDIRRMSTSNTKYKFIQNKIMQ